MLKLEYESRSTEPPTPAWRYAAHVVIAVAVAGCYLLLVAVLLG